VILDPLVNVSSQTADENSLQSASQENASKPYSQVLPPKPNKKDRHTPA